MGIEQRIKKAGILLIVGILLCSMFSCGKAETKVQIIEDSEAEPEYLSFFSVTGMENTDLSKYWSDRFAESYNQQVYFNHDGAAYYDKAGLSYRELLEKRQESSLPDDLYIINAEDVIDFEKKGYWMDLSEMDFVNNLSDVARYQSTYNGKIFSVPLIMTGFGFYWNVTMLEEHGLAVPRNLEEFLVVCEKLKDAGILPFGANKGYALTVPAMCTGLDEVYRGSDQKERIKALNSGRVPISFYMREGFEFLSLMIEKGYLDPQQALDTDPGKGDRDMFLAGKCAFICTELSVISQEAKDNNFQVEFTGIPVLADGCITVYGASSRLCVNPNSKHLGTTLKFIEMVGTTEALDESAVQNHALSSAKNSEVVITPLQENIDSLLKQPGQIPNQDFALHFNTWENIRNVSREICQGISVDEACAKLDELQRTELEIYTQNK